MKTVYKTDDGKYFDTHSEALRHELTGAGTILQRMIDESDDLRLNSEDRQAMALWLIKNIERINEIITGERR